MCVCKIISHHKIEDLPGFITEFYGITQDPETKDYIMVLNYAEDGSLRNYGDTNFDKLNWDTKFLDLWGITAGLFRIHQKELIHRDLHIGNILKSSKWNISITDMGLCKPTNYNELESTNNINNVYGV